MSREDIWGRRTQAWRTVLPGITHRSPVVGRVGQQCWAPPNCIIACFPEMIQQVNAVFFFFFLKFCLYGLVLLIYSFSVKMTTYFAVWSQHLGFLLSVGGYWQKPYWYMSEQQDEWWCSGFEIITRLKFPFVVCGSCLNSRGLELWHFTRGSTWVTTNYLPVWVKRAGLFS